MKIFARRWSSVETLSPRLRGFRGESRFLTRRLYSTSHDGDGDVESFKVTCGSAGHITVDIHNSSALSSPATPLIIYLPPLGAHLRSTHPAIPSFLLSRDLPLAQINYRWNHTPSPPTLPSASSPALLSSSPGFSNHPFPTPLHDTLHAWSWLLEEFLPSLAKSSTLPQNSTRYGTPYITPPSSPTRYQKPRPILIYGSYLGGTLSTVLGLTESRLSTSRTGVKILGMVIYNGIFDWSSIATSKPPSSSSPPPVTSPPYPSPSSQWTLQTLHSVKTKLFTSPSSAFDPFASPTLFFRSSGLSPSSPIPRYFPGQSPPSPPPSQSANKIDEAALAGMNITDTERADLLSMLGAEDSPPSPHPHPSGLYIFDDPGDESDPESGKVKDEKEGEQLEWGRKSPLKFPPAGSGLRIPRSLFIYSTSSTTSLSPAAKSAPKTKAGLAGEGDDEIQQQAEEMVRVMRRSIVTHEFKDRVVWAGDEDADAGDAHTVSEERVRIRGVGDGQGERELGEVVGGWIEEVV